MITTHPRLADLLENRRDAIVADWLERVRADRRVPSADELTRPALLDHVPTLIAAIVDRLRGKVGAAGDTAQQSRWHGAMRSEQEYSLEELLREVSLLRQVLIETWIEFDAKHGFEPPEQLESIVALNALLDQVIAESAASFFEHQQKALLEVNSQLAEKDHRRLQMLRTIIHEIANHLNAANLIVTVLRRSPDEASVEHSLTSIERSVASMTTLMRQLLEFATLASAGEQAAPRPIADVTPIFEECAASARPLAEAKGLTFLGACDAGIGPVNTDPGMLRRICLNLTTNAVKYTEAGRVGLRFSSGLDGSWCIEVSDTGMGIADGDQTRIFDEFFRATSSRERQPGVGLGLAITRRLVDLLGGRIELDSAPGVGSTFRVVLPRQ